MAWRDFMKFLNTRKDLFYDKPIRMERSHPKNKDDKNGKSERKCFKRGDQNHLIKECPKLSRNINQRAFAGGSWSDSDEDEEERKGLKYLYGLKQSNEDDIIFGSTKKELCFAFEKLMHEKFQMSSMGELTFFLGLQVKQKKDDIFISQDKYDEDGEEVDVHMYRSMIGSLMCHTPRRGLDGIRVRRRDFVEHLKYRYTFPRSNQNRRDLPRDIPLDSVEILRHDVKRSKSENKGKVSTEMELVLEETQQGTSYEVSISTEGVEELKRKVKIKGEKKEALLTLRQKPGQ
ncbi:hypothetical protein Tco_1285962 [Tanacetum coccineum]